MVEPAVIADKYRLVTELGKGATGTVWRAIQIGLERPVAIKVMHPHIAQQADAKVRFVREARVAASLRDPSSVSVLDFGEDNGALYLVMELVEGETLRARMQRGTVPFAEAVTIVRQVAHALAAAHKIRLVHRDIKPENVILPSGNRPLPAKVVDFGLAFIMDPDDTPMIGRMTVDGSVTGTPAYMAPEQVRGGSIGPPADVYSLGCVFYELLGGRPPFVGSMGEVLTRHAYAPAVPLRQLPLAELPPAAIDELVGAMLAKSSASRPTASRVAAVLAAYETPTTSDRIGRASMPVMERSARAIAAPPVEADESADALAVGVVGAMDEDLELSLAASRIELRPWADDVIGPEPVVWIQAASIARITAIAAAGKAVVARVPERDAARLPELIRAGVVEAVASPVDADDLVRRLWRASRLRRVAR